MRSGGAFCPGLEGGTLCAEAPAVSNADNSASSAPFRIAAWSALARKRLPVNTLKVGYLSASLGCPGQIRGQDGWFQRASKRQILCPLFNLQGHCESVKEAPCAGACRFRPTRPLKLGSGTPLPPETRWQLQGATLVSYWTVPISDRKCSPCPRRTLCNCCKPLWFCLLARRFRCARRPRGRSRSSPNTTRFRRRSMPALRVSRPLRELSYGTPSLLAWCRLSCIPT